MPELTQEFVRARLDYNPETGVLTWKARDRGESAPEKSAWTSWIGKPAGCVQKSSGSLQVLGASAARVIWLWVYGSIPKTVVHKNGDPLDNRLSNLAPYKPRPKRRREDMTREYVREAFDYDEKTGKLFWRHRPRSHFSTDKIHHNFNSRFAGREAGSTDKFGRLVVIVGCKNWFGHRLIWLLHTGELPDVLDHIDRDPTNNRIENLRPCTKSENMINSRRRAEGRIAGVCKVRPGVWEARLSVMGKMVLRESFKSRKEAKQAYEKCLRENFGEFVPNV